MNTPHLFPYPLRGPGIAANFRFARSLAEIDRWGLELANRHHVWSAKERRAFERRVRELKAVKK